jgi:uncharacterized protein YrrD
MIDPSNLMIIGYELDGPLLTERPSFIRIADIRELSDVGMIIDSSDEFIGTKDVIAIESIYNLGFKLLGLSVIDESKQKLGKVNDYTVDTGSFVIQQLNINRGMLKSLAETELLVHRTQIIEINNKTIIVRTAAKKLAPIIRPTQLSYLNPFRPTTTQTENSNT